jgi:hypothetical protein
LADHLVGDRETAFQLAEDPASLRDESLTSQVASFVVAAWLYVARIGNLGKRGRHEERRATKRGEQTVEVHERIAYAEEHVAELVACANGRVANRRQPRRHVARVEPARVEGEPGVDLVWLGDAYDVEQVVDGGRGDDQVSERDS